MTKHKYRKRPVEIEAIRLLRAMVLHIADDEVSDKTPKHECAYKTNPERGHCRFCKDWADAVEMTFPEETYDRNID